MLFRFLTVALTALVVSTAPGVAQNANPFGGFKHDNTKPIEITSDALEVRQAENIAVFSGNVIAGQGTLRLTADRVEVFYQKKDQGGTGAIRTLKAKGNVLLSNGAETAKGAWGEYDVPSGKVRMGGNVVLTQGQNVLSGQSLAINLNEGTGRMEGGRVTTILTPQAN